MSSLSNVINNNNIAKGYFYLETKQKHFQKIRLVRIKLFPPEIFDFIK